MRAPPRRVRLAAASALAIGAPAITGAQLPTVTRGVTIGCEACGDARELARPQGVFVAPNGDVIITDASPPMIRRFDTSGRIAWSGGARGRGPGEYLFPLHVAAAPDGALHVIDMTGRRITSLAGDGSVRATIPFPDFAAAASAPGTGDALVIVTDDFRDSLHLVRWQAGDRAAARFGETIVNTRASGQPISQPAVAISPTGELAVVAAAYGEYRIRRYDRDGRPLPPITRDIERVRRTPQELEELRSRMQTLGGRAAAAERAAGGRATAGPPSDWMSVKPHFAIDALRYDGRGRLWVRTMRAAADRTTFDIFASDGAYLGELHLSLAITSYGIAGATLATVTESPDGVPQVVLWSIR